jgi:hypothetical protein
MNTNPKSSKKTIQVVDPVAHVATATSTGQDCEGFRFLEVVVNVGAVVSGATVTITLEHSDLVGGTYAAITGAAFTAIAVGNTGTMRLLEVDLGSKINKFVRAVLTYAGNGSTHTAVVGVTFNLTGPRRSALCTNTYDAQVYVSGSN